MGAQGSALGDARRAVRAAVAIALLAALITPSVAAANGFAYGLKAGASFDGVRGTQWIRTDPATVAGIGYVHAIQVQRNLDPNDPDFIAIGTMNGVGVSGTQCANHYDPLWGIYVDWVLYGVYTCKDIVANYIGVGGAANSTIQWTFCDGASAYRWVLSFASTVRACVNASWHSGGRIVWGIETVPTSTERNLDIRWLDPQQNLVGNSWTDISKPVYEESPSGLSYTSSFLSHQFDVYLPPWE